MDYLIRVLEVLSFVFGVKHPLSNSVSPSLASQSHKTTLSHWTSSLHQAYTLYIWSWIHKHYVITSTEVTICVFVWASQYFTHLLHPELQRLV